jgi:hypothetical protein
MFRENENTNFLVSHRWLLIIGSVVVILLLIQIVRVNRRPVNTLQERAVPTYTAAGSLVSGEISIEPNQFQSYKINLNRRARLTGTFQTGSVKRRVSVLVVKGSDVDDWVANPALSTRIVETGYVPGGKVSPMLDPGEYLFIVDSRQNNEVIPVNLDFTLE